MNLPTLPNSNIDESTALGAMMTSVPSLEFALDNLRRDDFYYVDTKLVFDAMADLKSEGKLVDPLAVGSELQRRNKLDDIGGPARIMLMVEMANASAQHEFHIESVKKYSLLRAMIDKFGGVISDCYTHEKKVEDILDGAEKFLYQLSVKRSGSGLSSIQDFIFEQLDEIEKIRKAGKKTVGLETGLPCLDGVLSGLQRGNMIVLAARPSVGKSSLAMDFIRHSILAGHPTAFFSLEMSKREVFNRLLGVVADIPVFQLMNGSFGDDKSENLTRAGTKLYDAPFYLDCSSAGQNASTVRSLCRKLATKLALHDKKLDLIVIDYMQLMGGNNKNFENRQNEVSEISRALKMTAIELDVPLIALSQLNRKPEDRAGGEPLLSDLRESGSIEQDADVVLMMWREENKTRLSIKKHRNGPMGKFSLYFDKEKTSFRELSEDVE